MIIVPDYRGFRIQVDAIAVDGRYNAEVRMRRLFSQDKPHVDTVTCLKLMAEHAAVGRRVMGEAIYRCE